MAIEVLTAVYGSSAGGNLVTEIVQTRLNQGNDDVLVNNEALGGDPTPGIVKQFGILYSVNGGLPQVRCAVEGTDLELVD